MPIISLTDRQAAQSIPVIRHALKASNFPAWVKAAFAAIIRYAPQIIAIIVQLAPLFAAPANAPPGGAALAPSPGGPDVLDDPGLRPECRAAIVALRAGRLD